MSETTLYSSVARTATPTAVTLRPAYHKVLHLVIDVTAVTSTPSVIPTIDGFDTLSGKWYNLLTGGAYATTGTRVLKIAPFIAAVANLAVSDALPEQIRLTMTHGNANSITYTAAAHLL